MSQTLTSSNPATGQTVFETETASAQTVEDAVETARGASSDWAAKSLEERLEVLGRVRDELLDSRVSTAEAVTAESGKPVSEALVADVMTTLEATAFLDRHGESILEPEARRLDNLLLRDRTSQLRREPVGVVGVIAPWNYPLAIPASQALFALAAGNTVVLKPSELTPGVGRRLVDLFHRAGVPEDVLQLVQGPGKPTGQALVDAAPDTLVFTGSVETGEAIRKAAPPGTEVILELGGNDPMVVLDDANLERTARGAVWAAFTNAGQTCAAVERLYAPESNVEELLDRIVEHTEALTLGPGDEDVDVGPMITEEAARRALAHVEDAVDHGARVLVGGGVREDLGPRFVEPTVLVDVPPEADVMNEETFGPVLPVATVQGEEEAIRRANDTRYGLTASVWTTRPERGDRLADRLQAGTVTINDHAYTYAACETPWGGLKSSGRGHTHGRAGLEALTRTKHVNHASGSRTRSPWWFPYDDDLRTLADDGLEFLYGSRLKGLNAAGALVRRLLG